MTPRCVPATGRKRKRISPATLHALNGAVAEEHRHLPPDSPRVRPTLPQLSILEAQTEDNLAAIAGGRQ